MVRFFLLSPGGNRPGFGRGQDATADLTAWVRESCVEVPPVRWQMHGDDAASRLGDPSGGLSRGFGGAGQTLYDCAAPAVS
jgi:hypothetical protein